MESGIWANGVLSTGIDFFAAALTMVYVGRLLWVGLCARQDEVAGSGRTASPRSAAGLYSWAGAGIAKISLEGQQVAARVR
jgi:hypothetical protein